MDRPRFGPLCRKHRKTVVCPLFKSARHSGESRNPWIPAYAGKTIRPLQRGVGSGWGLRSDGPAGPQSRDRRRLHRPLKRLRRSHLPAAKQFDCCNFKVTGYYNRQKLYIKYVFTHSEYAHMYLPPAHTIRSPVTKDDRSDARNTATFATSCGFPARLSAMPAISSAE